MGRRRVHGPRAARGPWTADLRSAVAGFHAIHLHSRLLLRRGSCCEAARHQHRDVAGGFDPLFARRFLHTRHVCLARRQLAALVRFRAPELPSPRAPELPSPRAPEPPSSRAPEPPSPRARASSLNARGAPPPLARAAGAHVVRTKCGLPPEIMFVRSLCTSRAGQPGNPQDSLQSRAPPIQRCPEWTLVFRFGHSRQTQFAQALGYPLTKMVVSFRNM